MAGKEEFKYGYLLGNGSDPVEVEPPSLLDKLNNLYLITDSAKMSVPDIQVKIQESLREIFNPTGGVGNKENTEK